MKLVFCCFFALVCINVYAVSDVGLIAQTRYFSSNPDNKGHTLQAEFSPEPPHQHSGFANKNGYLTLIC